MIVFWIFFLVTALAGLALGVGCLIAAEGNGH